MTRARGPEAGMGGTGRPWGRACSLSQRGTRAGELIEVGVVKGRVF